MEPGDVVATIFLSLGLNPGATLPGPSGRPFPLVDFGNEPIKAVSYTHLTLPTKRIV